MEMNSYYYPALWMIITVLVVGIFAVSAGVAFFQQKIAPNATENNSERRQMLLLNQFRIILQILALLLIVFGITIWFSNYQAGKKEISEERQKVWPVYDHSAIWKAPDPFLAKTDAEKDLIAYGRDLIVHTQDYYGEDGLVRPASINNLNCQSCHLDAGSKPFGNNYFAVASTYPQIRARSGALETIPKRVNDCFQRSLNGQPIDTTSREMQAILAYIRWLGTGVPKGEKPKGTGLVELPFLDRAADPAKGKIVYQGKCSTCHGANGQGLPMPDSPRRYPPLWGDESYNMGAGLFRLSRFAGYVKANMPFGATYDNPQLTDEEAWDVAAFVNSQPRPAHPFLATDWPDIAKKTFDHPFGPYKDTFPETEHKYGPFGPIVAFNKQHQKK